MVFSIAELVILNYKCTQFGLVILLINVCHEQSSFSSLIRLTAEQLREPTAVARGLGNFSKALPFVVLEYFDRQKFCQARGPSIAIPEMA